MNLFRDYDFEPMLLSEEKRPFHSKQYLFELKYDGVRALLFVSKDVFMVRSRHRHDITSLFPELQEIQDLVHSEVIFDGEIVCFFYGVPDFSVLQKRIHLKKALDIKKASVLNPVTFVVFDILYKDKNVTNLPLLERKKMLEKFPDTNTFVKSFYILGNGIAFFQNIKKLKLEGMVAKEISSTYEINTRSKEWIKVKNLQEKIFWVGGFTEKGNTPFFSLLLGEFKGEKFYYVGRVSVPRKHSLYSMLLKERKSKNPFVNFEEDTIHYCKPKYRCEIEFLMRGKEGVLRHPVFRKCLNLES